MTFLTDAVYWGIDPVKQQRIREDNSAKRTRQVAKFVSLEAAQNSKEWLSRRMPPSRSGAALYLTLFGYRATDGYRWSPTCAPWPRFKIHVTMHAEINNHTWYLIKCSLSLGATSEPMEWYAARRLCHIRKFLYDHVKREFGYEYKRHFADSPFAHHGAIAGTSARLNAWCNALTACINRGIASPYIVALTLKILDAPHLHALDSYLRASDVGIDSIMQDALQDQVDSVKTDTPDEASVCPLSAAIDAMELYQIDVEFEDSELDMKMQDSKAFCIERRDVQEEEFIDPDAENVAQYLQAFANNAPTSVADEAVKIKIEDLCAPILTDIFVEGDMSSPCRVIDMHESAPSKLGFLPIIEEEKTDLTTSTTVSLDDCALPYPEEVETKLAGLTHL